MTDVVADLPEIVIEPDKPRAGRKLQIRPRLRHAIDLIVKKGLNQSEAAKTAGMQPHSLSLALARPHVKSYLDSVKRAHLEGATLVAWHTVVDLARNANSEDVRHKAARTILERAGELGGDSDDGRKIQQQLIQIVTQSVNIGQQPPTEQLPAIVEAPPYRVIEHDPSDSEGV